MKHDVWVYGVKALAGLLGMSERTLHRLLKQGGHDLPVCRIGGRWGAHPGDIDRWKRQGS